MIVQSAHAAHLVGLEQTDRTVVPHVCLIGVRDWQELSEIEDYLVDQKIDYKIFYEPDIKQHTALATFPLRGPEREPLSHFETLKLTKEDEVV
jgi:hypothetical protein